MRRQTPKNLVASGMVASAALLSTTTFTLTEGYAAPAFDCNKARTPNEFMICDDSYLGDLDRKLTNLYVDLLSRVNRSAGDVIREDQKFWLRQRQSCISDFRCTESAYKRRIAQIQKELQPFLNPPSNNNNNSNDNGQGASGTATNNNNPPPTPPKPQATVNVGFGAYRIKSLSTGKFLHSDGNGDKLTSIRYQPNDAFTHFVAAPRKRRNHFAFFVSAESRYLHADGNGDRRISTRYQPVDAFTRFKLSPADSGCYFVQTEATNRYWTLNASGLLVTRQSPGGRDSMFCFTFVR